MLSHHPLLSDLHETVSDACAVLARLIEAASAAERHLHSLAVAGDATAGAHSRALRVELSRIRGNACN
jgi:hypothetical protein